MYAGQYYAETGYAMLPELLTEPEQDSILYHTNPIVLGEQPLTMGEAPVEDTTIYLEA
jgi:hypothetical protein